MWSKLLLSKIYKNVLFITKSSTFIQSKIDFGHQMKLLNEKKQFKQSLDLFERLKDQNMKQLSSFIICQALKACGQLGDLQRGSSIHRFISSQPNIHPPVLTALIQFYMQCNDVKRAESVFTEIANKALFHYGAMMKGYVKHAMPEKAIHIFDQINSPDDVAILLLFNACAQLGNKDALDRVKNVWKSIPSKFYTNTNLVASLIDALMKCGDVENARSVFDSSKSKALHMFNALMSGYVKNGMPQQAIDIFTLIKTPNVITITILLNACAQLETKEVLDLVKDVWRRLPPEFLSNVYVLSSGIDAFMKCGDVENARSVFDSSESKAMHMFNALMSGYVKNGMPQQAIDIFKLIKAPDVVTITILLNACAQLETTESLNLVKYVWKRLPLKFLSNVYVLSSGIDALMRCGDVKEAKFVFEKSKTKHVAMFGALMKGYIVNEMAPEAISLYNEIKKNNANQLDDILHLLAINAAAKIGMFSQCQSIVKAIPVEFLSTHKFVAALIDMWGKAGSVEKAEEVFQQHSSLDHVGYGAMINAYGLNGMGLKAVELFHRVPSEYIDEPTNVSVLNACSHSGLVDKARSIFKNIQNKTERIYTVMVDVLSRAFLFEEAEALINEYEQTHPPLLQMYMALLSGARNRRNKHLGEKIYHRMKTIFPQSSDSLVSAAVLLSNIYCGTGDLEKASTIKNDLMKSGAKKRVGLAWTDTNGEIFEFRAHDRSHPRSAEIYVEVEKISKELIQHGHKYNSSWVTRPIQADETVESVLCGHSEKLAIAWNFVVNPNTKMIQLTKNLRVCGDCHEATKLIAAIRKCHIIVRDANRIHHFGPDGVCSCNDYF
ncbi:hypothetical protein I4U23_002810 [Adineta vaga]|nr:hypothetical protein I4U23_002810 [Adineta vaga]